MNERIEKITTKDRKQVYLKKGMFDEYRVVYPAKNEDGTINWFNSLAGGSWGYVLKCIGIMLIVLLFIYAYNHDTKVCRDTLLHLNDTCVYFQQTMANSQTSIYVPNITNFNG